MSQMFGSKGKDILHSPHSGPLHAPTDIHLITWHTYGEPSKKPTFLADMSVKMGGGGQNPRPLFFCLWRVLSDWGKGRRSSGLAFYLKYKREILSFENWKYWKIRIRWYFIQTLYFVENMILQRNLGGLNLTSYYHLTSKYEHKLSNQKIG